MAITWNNVSPIQKEPFTAAPPAIAPAYQPIPRFRQTTGVLPGQAPRVGTVVAPTRTNMRGVINSMPNVLRILLK